MKPQISKTLHTLLIPFLLLIFIAPPHIKMVGANATAPLAVDAELKFPGPDDQFIVYYNRWPTIGDEFYKKMGGRYKLIILNTGDLVPPKDIEDKPEAVLAYKKGRITLLREAGAMVFAYQSIGEENLDGNHKDPYPGDGHGPCGCDDPAKCCKSGFASYYIDNGKGKPAIHGAENFVSAYVNAGSPVWRTRMALEAKEKMDLGCDGLFLDTLDTATTKGFEWTQAGMIKLLKELHGITPNIIVNRGIALLETPFADDYKQASWAIMYEDFFTDWKGDKGVLLKKKEQKASVDYWAPLLKGKNVLVVDFANCKQLEKNDEVVTKQMAAVTEVNKKAEPKWPNYIADHDFKEVRYQFRCENQAAPLSSKEHPMPKKKKLIKKHSAKANLHVVELTRAGSSLDLAIYADNEKIGTMIIGRGSLLWYGGERQLRKRIPWSRFAAMMDELAYGKS